MPRRLIDWVDSRTGSRAARAHLLDEPIPAGTGWSFVTGSVVLFLIPYCVVAWIYSFPYVRRSWALLEPSSNPGGMPGLYILKSFILVFILLVALQGIAMAFRSILVLAGREDLLPPQYRYQQQA